MARCSAIKPNGERCRGIAASGSNFCPAHDPSRAAERRRNASKAARSKPNREIAGIKSQLSELAEQVLTGELETGRAAIANQLINTRLRAIEIERRVREQEEFEERLERLGPNRKGCTGGALRG